MTIANKDFLVEIHYKNQKEILNLITQEDVQIPPRGTTSVRIIHKDRKHIGEKEKYYIITDIEEMMEDDEYCITPTIQKGTSKWGTVVTIENRTDNWLEIPSETRVAIMEVVSPNLNSIEPYIQENELPEVEDSVCEAIEMGNEPKVSYLTREVHKKMLENLSNDHTKEEMEAKMKKFDEEGYYSESAETIAEHLNSLCDMTVPPQTKEPTIEELVNKIKLDHLQDNHANKLRRIFTQHHTILARSLWDCPLSPLTEAFVPLKEGCTKTCQNCQYRPIPLEQRETVQEAIEALEKAGIVEKCTKATPFISNLLCGKRKDGSPRILLDTRVINNATTKLPCTMNSLAEIYSFFAGATHVSSMDISNCFYAIKIRDEDKPYFSFYDTRKIRYCFARCPQGWKNSPYYMNNLLSQVIMDCKEAVIYADDIFIITKTGRIEDHIIAIEKLVGAIEEAHLRVKPHKLQLITETLDVLGFTFHKDKFSVPLATKQAIQEIKVPISKKRIKGFVNMCGYFRKNVMNFSEMTRNLNNLSALDHRKFKMTEEAMNEFTNMKKEMMKAKGISTPIPGATYICYSDASEHTASFVVFQKNNEDQEDDIKDNEDNYRFLGAHSRSFTKAERSYPIFKKEVLSVTSGLASFKHYLEFSKRIILHVDAKAIMYLRLCKNSNYMLLRLSHAICAHNIVVKHLPGKLNVLADYLSRANEPPPETNRTSDKYHPLTSAQAEKLLALITTPNTYVIPEDIMKAILTQDSPGNPLVAKKIAKKSTKSSISNTTTLPLTQKDRKVRMPKVTERHPFYRNQKHQLKAAWERGEKPLHLIPHPDDINHPNLMMLQMEKEPPHNDERQLASSHNRSKRTAPTPKPRTNKNTQDSKAANEKENSIKETSVVAMPTQSDPQEEDDNQLDNTLQLTMRIIAEGTISIDVIKSAQQQDEDLQKHIRKTEPPFLMNKGVLLINQKGQDKLVVPQSLLQPLLFTYHHNKGHTSKQRMLDDIRRDFWRQSLREEVFEYVKNCIYCISQKIPNNSKPKLGRKPLPIQPRSEWAFDQVMGLGSSEGYNYINIWTCTFSLYRILIAAKTREAKELLDGFKWAIIRPFGIPDAIYGDGETSLHSKTFISYTEQHRILVDKSMPHSPFSNGMAEVSVKKCKEAIRIFTRQTGESWHKNLEILNYTLNRSPTASGYSPEELFFGQKRDKDMMIKQIIKYNSVEDYLQKIKQKIQKEATHHVKVRENRNEASRAIANRRRKDIKHELGETVFLKNMNPTIGGGSALSGKFIGPYKIIKVDNNRQQCTLKDKTSGQEREAHFTHIININRNAGKDNPIPTKIQHLKRNRPTRSNTNEQENEFTYNLRPRK